MTGNVPGWSLSTEAAFYLVFPLLVLALTPKRLPLATVGAIVFWGLSQFVHHWLYVNYYPSHPYPSTVHDLLFYMPPLHLNEFFLGAVVGAWSRRSAKIGYLFDGAAFVAAGAIACALAYGGVLAWHGIYIVGFVNGGLAPFMLLFIYSLPRAKGRWAKIFELRWMLLLGEISYAIYLLQIPVAYTGLNYQIFNMMDAQWPSLGPWKIIPYIVALIAISWIAFAAVERPARGLIRSIMTNRINPPRSVTE